MTLKLRKGSAVSMLAIASVLLVLFGSAKRSASHRLTSLKILGEGD